jgi:hypothetical protein
MMEKTRMNPHFDLTKDDFNTSYAPLYVLGQEIWARETLTPLRDCELISLKSCDHAPGEKLMDAFLLILAGHPTGSGLIRMSVGLKPLLRSVNGLRHLSCAIVPPTGINSDICTAD